MNLLKYVRIMHIINSAIHKRTGHDAAGEPTSVADYNLRALMFLAVCPVGGAASARCRAIAGCPATLWPRPPQAGDIVSVLEPNMDIVECLSPGADTPGDKLGLISGWASRFGCMAGASQDNHLLFSL